MTALSCDKVPLLAPTGSVITIFPAASTVPLNSAIEIVATVIEQGVATAPSTPTTPTTPTTPGQTPTTPAAPSSTSTTGAGTPVQNGTLVTFTTTIGRIEPAEARTNNGQVRVKFVTGGQSGSATITAFSGGASGKIENLKVGSAAVERVLVTATPQTLGASGGTSTIAARVEDVNGAGLPGISVNFVADVGSLSASSAVTDQDGVARVQLTASRPTKVTANVAGKTADVTVALNPRTGIKITPPTAPVAARVPAIFTVGVAAAGTGGTGPNITNVTVSWGDTTQQSLGAISADTPVAHTYEQPGNFIVTATATDTSGFTESVSTVITILPAQPPTVTITAPASASVNTSVIVRATVTGNTSTIQRYVWTFGPDAIPQTVSTASTQTTVRWLVPGTKTFSVVVDQGPENPPGDQVASIQIVGTTAPIR
jgi:hypothetical protein